MGSMFGFNYVIAKDSQSCTYCCYVMLDIKSMSIQEKNNSATHYHAQSGHLDKTRVIKGLVVCYVVWLGSMKGMGLRTYARFASLIPCCKDDYRAQVHQHPIETKHIIHYSVYYRNVLCLLKLKLFSNKYRSVCLYVCNGYVLTLT